MKIAKLFLSFLCCVFSFTVGIGQSWLWGKMGIGDAFVNAIASDKNGNCYLAGMFYNNDTIHFGSYDLVNNGVNNGEEDEQFLVKYDKLGNLIWAKQTINVNNGYGSIDDECFISLDASGNSYLVGNFPDTLVAGLDTLINNMVASFSLTTFIAKYDTNGNVVWAKKANVLNDSSRVAGKAISTDVYGNSFVTGLFEDTIQFGSQTLTTPSPLGPVFTFLVKYDSSGNVKWARQSTSNTIYGATALSVAADRNGNSIICGWFVDSITFGSYKLGAFPTEAGDFFVVKYDSLGNVLWAKQAVIPNLVNPYNGCEGRTVATDKIGNIYVAGIFMDTMILDSYTLVGSHTDNFFLAKYDPDGNVVWAKASKALDNNQWGVGSISADNENHIYLSAGGGQGHCKVVFSNDTLSVDDTSIYDGPSLIYKLDSNGNALCSSIILGGARIWNYISSDTSGKYVYVGATTATEMIFGDDTVNPFSVPVDSIFA